MFVIHVTPSDDDASFFMNGGSKDDNIELQPLPERDGFGSPRPATPAELADDEDEDGHDATTALLRPEQSAVNEQREQQKHKRRRKLWPQIKDILIQSAPTLLLTTVGLLFTGELLDHVSRWQAMTKIDQLIMIIPVVLNLKGNLEMNLSARLGTAANVGELDDKDVRRRMIWGNLGLLQVQAAVVSFVASCVTVGISLVMPGSTGPSVAAKVMPRRPVPHKPASSNNHVDFGTFIMVASTAMGAASLSSILLGSFMCLLIVTCRYLSLDPDNIAPPVASCLGDLVTLLLLGFVSSILIHFLYTPVPILVGILVVLVAATCFISTRKNPYTRALVGQGWSPLFGAMVISSLTGIVLDLFVSRYEGFALLAVVISGLPGSVGSIFVSRLSTALHAVAEKEGKSVPVSAFGLMTASALGSGVGNGFGRGEVSPVTPPHAGPSQPNGNGDIENGHLAPPTPRPSRPSPAKIQPSQKVVMITLLIITLPVELIFLGVLRGLGWLHLPMVFVGFSILFFCCAVTSSLLIARSLTNFLWSRSLDPDLYALPIHSALMDLVGQILLVICFEIVSALGVKLKVLKPGTAG